MNSESQEITEALQEMTAINEKTTAPIAESSASIQNAAITAKE